MEAVTGADTVATVDVDTVDVEIKEVVGISSPTYTIPSTISSKLELSMVFKSASNAALMRARLPVAGVACALCFRLAPDEDVCLKAVRVGAVDVEAADVEAVDIEAAGVDWLCRLERRCFFLPLAAVAAAAAASTAAADR